jgi:hypothetical protein
MKIATDSMFCKVTFNKAEFDADVFENTIKACNAATEALNSRRGIVSNHKKETDTEITFHFSRKCDCAQCVFHAEAKRAMDDRDTDTLIRLLNKAMDDICNIGEDLSYHKCVLNGSWGSAVEQLERALEKARKTAASDERES